MNDTQTTTGHCNWISTHADHPSGKVTKRVFTMDRGCVEYHMDATRWPGRVPQTGELVRFHWTYGVVVRKLVAVDFYGVVESSGLGENNS